MKSPWLCLEAIPGLVASEADWQNMAGENFPALSSLCLQPASWLLRSIPCPHRCGCNHFIIPRHDGSGAVAVCCCAKPSCADIPLSIRDITPLKLSRASLGRALCKAFGFATKLVDLPSPNTFQFGSWSADAVPAILTIQVQNSVFRRVVAELGARLRNPFILFAPTADFLDAPSKEILENFGAAFFAIDSHVTLADNGTLAPTSPPGELFARFNPQPKDIDENVATRAFALVRQFDSATLAVFREYCLAGHSAAETARKLHSSKSAVMRRLKLIRAKTGLAPARLRALSSHFEKMRDDLTNPNAKHIRPTNLIYDDSDPGEPQE